MKTEEKDFQQVANEYAHDSIETIAEELRTAKHTEDCKAVVSQSDYSYTHDWVDEFCTYCDMSKADAVKTPCTEYDRMDDCDCGGRDGSQITENVLSVEVRSGWYMPGDVEGGVQYIPKPTEYNILLGTGGPASRIVGDLDEYGQPTSARFEYQDWFKPWTLADTTNKENEIMLEYARHFYFGE